MESHPGATHKRIVWIDALRGIAVLLVLGRHMPIQFSSAPPVLLKPLQLWKQIGWTGVDLFFVISGFFVSGILFKEYKALGHIHVARFLIRRGIRIMAPFYAFLILSAPFHFQFLNGRHIFNEIFFLQNYGYGRTIWGHTWTLAVEAHFYLFLVGFLSFLARQKNRSDPFGSIFFIWTTLAVGCLILRIGTPFDDPAAMNSTHLRMDTLFFGALISYGYHFHREKFGQFAKRFGWFIAMSAFFLFLPALCMEIGKQPWMTRFGFSCVYLSAGGFLVNLIFSATHAPKLLARVGQMSYSTYLWHIPMREIVLSITPHQSLTIAQSWLSFFSYVLLALFSGYISFQFIEKPSLAWRDKHFA